MKLFTTSVAALLIATAPALAADDTVTANPDIGTLESLQPPEPEKGYAMADIIGSEVFTTSQGVDAELAPELGDNLTRIGVVRDAYVSSQGVLVGVDVNIDDALMENKTLYFPASELTFTTLDMSTLSYVVTHTENDMIDMESKERI